MTKLVIDEQDGALLESLYYLAIKLADPSKAAKLLKQNGTQKDAAFWRHIYMDGKYPETLLVSATVNELEMPFGAYVVEYSDDTRLEIVPWFFSAKFDLKGMDRLPTEENPSAEEMRKYARTINIAADFIDWLKKYDEMRNVKEK